MTARVAIRVGRLFKDIFLAEKIHERATIQRENLILGGILSARFRGSLLSIKSYGEIRDLVAFGPADPIRVKILRGGEQLELKAVTSR